jgi:hypothetical protein
MWATANACITSRSVASKKERTHVLRSADCRVSVCHLFAGQGSKSDGKLENGYNPAWKTYLPSILILLRTRMTYRDWLWHKDPSALTVRPHALGVPIMV